MNILQVTSHLNAGGITSHVLALSRALADRGHRVVIASGGGQLERATHHPKIEHWAAPLATSADFSPRVFAAANALAQRALPEALDIVHGHTRVGQVVADRIGRRLGVPMVATWHGFFRPNLGRRLWPCTGELTVAISEPVRQHLMLDFRVPEDRIRLIPHGIDPAPFQPGETPAAQGLRETLRVPSDAVVIGTIARLVPSKGIDLLIRSLPIVRQSAPTARLLLVGDGEARGSLEALAQSLGVGDAVHFAGMLQETVAALALMRVFVFIPAHQEGFGLSLLEAMAAGRPIVAVRRGKGAAWVLEQGAAGQLVEPEDPAALAGAIVRYLHDAGAAADAGARARNMVNERFSLDRMAAAVQAVYEELA